MFAQRPPVEWLRFERTTTVCRPRQVLAVVGAARVRLEADIGARLEVLDHGRTGVQECIAQRPVGAIADEGIEIGARCRRIVGRIEAPLLRVVRYPDRPGRARGGAADLPALLQKQRTPALERG